MNSSVVKYILLIIRWFSANKPTYRVALFFMVLFMTLSQILYKTAALTLSNDEFRASYYINSWLLLGLTSAFFGMVFWMCAISQVSLSKAYPWTAIIYLITPFAGLLLFDEKLTAPYFLGLLFILVGIVFTTRAISE